MKRFVCTVAMRQVGESCTLASLAALRPCSSLTRPMNKGAFVSPTAAHGSKLWVSSSVVSHQRRHYATAVEKQDGKKAKKPVGLAAWLWDQILHIWIGFKLLAANTRVAVRLRKQVMQGQVLTRRERLMLERTTADLLRLVPFSFFVLVPAAELLLPVALAMFPNLMPSTFVTDEQRRKKQIFENLQSGVSRRRLFDHMTATIISQEMFAVDSPSLVLFRSIHEGGIATGPEIRRLAPYFADDGPLALSKLPAYVLKDLAKAIGVYSPLEAKLLPKSWYDVRMRYAISVELEKREADDRLFASEHDLKSVGVQELEEECVRRRMRWLGPPDALRRQLRDWISLSLDENVPNHVLLFLHPCATRKQVMTDYLSKQEIDHILGLTKFTDSRMSAAVRSVTDKTQKQSRAEFEQRVMDEDIDRLVSRLEDIQKEDASATASFESVREAFHWKEEELLAVFDKLLVSNASHAPGSNEPGVEMRVLARGVVELMRQRDSKLDWPAKVSEVCLSLREFDIDVSDIITRRE